MTTQQITDPSEWREGDHAEWRDAHSDLMTTGTLSLRAADGLLHLGHIGGPIAIRWASGNPRAGNITVTREVADIPEPTGLGAVVKFADGSVAILNEPDDEQPWRMQGEPYWFSWKDHDHGPATAVLSLGVDVDGAR